MAKTMPQEVLLAVPAAKPKVIRELVKVLEPYKVRITTLPSLRDIVAGKVALQEIRQLSLEDLLERTPVGLDPGPVRQLIAGKCVLVTGAGGSIGSELCRQIAALRPRLLVLFERYENGLYTIATELGDRHGDLPVASVVGDITDKIRVDAVLGEYQPEIVFHAAAHKHVPLMELNPCEAFKNNILGTRILAEAAAQHGAERFVLISSDKAVNPSSIMGASKRVAERIVVDLSRKNGTRFIVVRFGNVLGSSGSVIPRFQEQIRAGGPVTVTHPEVYRFFMLTSEAVQLVLHTATQPETGVLYVLEMGEPICLLERARNVIRLSGYVPEEDIPIKIVGLRPGEKLVEDLVGSHEKAEPSGIEGILRIQPSAVIDPLRFREQVVRLEALAIQGDSQAAVAQLSEIVPDFHFPRGGRRLHPPQYRKAQLRNILPRLAQCQSADDLQALLKTLRKELDFQTFKIRFEAGVLPSALNGVHDFEVSDPNPPGDPALVSDKGVPSWTGRADIICQFRNSDFEIRNTGDAREAARVVGELLATKPAWKRRRMSENDDELLRILADGLGQWLSSHQSHD
jgi:FlaA1/EpsC-like NDP-sugar epimerase